MPRALLEAGVAQGDSFGETLVFRLRRQAGSNWIFEEKTSVFFQEAEGEPPEEAQRI